MSNVIQGLKFEGELCEYLSQNRFWVRRISQNQAGQPADIIAVRNKKAYLIDCKVCERDRFEFSRIESNQCTAMLLWKICGNGYGFFALRLSDDKIYMIDLDTIEALATTRSSIGPKEIDEFGVPFDRWVVKCR